MGFKEKEISLNGFVYSNFNYSPLVWHFCSAKSVKKIEKLQEPEADLGLLQHPRWSAL